RRGDRGRRVAVARVLQIARSTHLGGLIDRARRRLHGMALRQQEVAGVAIGDIDDVTALAEPGNVVAEDHLHGSALVFLGRVDIALDLVVDLDVAVDLVVALLVARSTTIVTAIPTLATPAAGGRGDTLGV